MGGRGGALRGLPRICPDGRSPGSAPRAVPDGQAHARVGTADVDFTDAAAWLARIRAGELA